MEVLQDKFGHWQIIINYIKWCLIINIMFVYALEIFHCERDKVITLRHFRSLRQQNELQTSCWLTIFIGEYQGYVHSFGDSIISSHVCSVYPPVFKWPPFATLLTGVVAAPATAGRGEELLGPTVAGLGFDIWSGKQRTVGNLEIIQHVCMYTVNFS